MALSKEKKDKYKKDLLEILDKEEVFIQRQIDECEKKIEVATKELEELREKLEYINYRKTL